jgi:hypothetical protein
MERELRERVSFNIVVIHYAASQKVAGLRPNFVIEFYLFT